MTYDFVPYGSLLTLGVGGEPDVGPSHDGATLEVPIGNAETRTLMRTRNTK